MVQINRAICLLLAIAIASSIELAGNRILSTEADSAQDLLEKSRVKYASLTSYADRGTVLNEFGTSSREEHKFVTYFSRAPRGYYFDFTKESGERFVIWGDPEAFHTWWSATKVTEDYPNPSNTGAFVFADVHSVGAAMKITPLLYSKGGLQGSFTNFTDASADGTDDIGGRRCYRLTGTARDIYSATGRESNVRKITVWIDAEALLIRKVVEEWKPLPGQIRRVTTTYEPQANPAIEQSKFRFTPPSE